MSSNGDMIVCGVSEDKLIEDIGVMVPKGEATPILGAQAVKSKDLWRLLSQGVIFQLKANSVLRVIAPSHAAPPVPKLQEERDRLSLENETLREENAQLIKENGDLYGLNVHLKGEVGRLERELKEATGKDAKLDAILELVKSRPTTVIQNVTGAPASSGLDVDDSAPIYIPSQIKSDNNGEARVSLKEEASDAGSLADASKALKGLRKGKSKDQ